MSVTVRDIAKSCGVSLATVSRVLNNNEKVKDATRQKVLDSMRSLNYDPLGNVPAVKKRSVEATGLVIPIWNVDSVTGFYSRAINAFYAHMNRMDGRCLLLTADKLCNAILEDRINPRTTLGIDRLLLAGVDHPDIETVYERLEKWDIPYVLIRRETERPGVPMIGNNDREGMEHLLNHLKGFGHTRTAFFNADAPFLAIRNEAFREYCRHEGWTCHDDLIHTSSVPSGNAEKWLDTVLNRYGVSAFVCTADETAAWVIRHCRKRGLRTPEDISVVSFNGGPLTEHFDPPITSLKIQMEKMVELGLMMLSQHTGWDRNGENRLELPLELTVRESTGPYNTTKGRKS